MRQAGRYMQQYRDVRKHHSLVEICKKPELAAEVTITAAEFLNVDAAIIFADLLLPLEVMGLPFHFAAGEGPVIEKPVRTAEDVKRAAHRSRCRAGICRPTQSRWWSKHFGAKLPVIGFCGAPFTLASYMVEGGGSRHYLEVKKLMYNSPEVWDELVGKLVDVLAAYAAEQVRSGADALQIFDSWVGCLSVEDYRRYALVPTTQLIQRLQKETNVPIIYFGTDSSTLLPSMSETGAEVIGLDWRIPLDEGWRTVGHQSRRAGQSRSGAAVRFVAGVEAARRTHSSPGRCAARVTSSISDMAFCRNTPVDNVKNLAQFVHEFTATAASSEEAMSKQAVLLIAHGSPERVEDIPEFLQNISRGRPMSDAVVREVQHRYSLIGSSPLTRITQAQADGVARELGVPAYVGMRNWHPFIADTLKQMDPTMAWSRRLRFAWRRTIREPALDSTNKYCSEPKRRLPSILSRNGTIIRC